MCSVPNTNMTIIIQDTWCESDDEDLLDFMKDKPYIVKSEEEILSYKDLHIIEGLFANTNIMNQIVSSDKIPDTYPDEFKELYNRDIRKLPYKDALKLEGDFFAKPIGNDKKFTGEVFSSSEEYFQTLPLEPDDTIYVAPVVKFVNEFRLFIADRKLFYMVESSDFILYEPSGRKVEPPTEFIDLILKMNTSEYIVVDIGLMETPDYTHRIWSVVEVNPPFSLNSYDMPIDKYYNYCINAWKWLIK